MPDQENPVHATCVSVDGKGVLIFGASGSGKTQTALTVLRRARAADITCHMVTDDQTLLNKIDESIEARCPEQTFGKVEVFGFGIVEQTDAFVKTARLVLAVDLVEDGKACRMRPEQVKLLSGVPLQHLILPQRQSDVCASAIFAALGYGLVV